MDRALSINSSTSTLNQPLEAVASLLSGVARPGKRNAAAPDPDLEIFREMQAGNEEALVEIMERHREPLYRFAYRYTGHEQDSRDITEETFVRAWFAAPRFQPRAKIVTWLFAIASNLCHDRQRRMSRARLEPLEGLRAVDPHAEGSPPPREFAAAGPGVADEAHLHEMGELLTKAVQQLPHNLRIAFIPFALENKSYQECAELLGCSEKTIETRVYRAKRQLRALLKPAFDALQSAE